MALATAERLSRGRLSDEILSSKIIDEVPLHAMTTAAAAPCSAI